MIINIRLIVRTESQKEICISSYLNTTMSTFVMPGVEVTNRYKQADTQSTHTIADELHNRNKTDSATS